MARLLLAIESATDWLSVALLEGERLIDLRRSPEPRQHATALLPTIDAMLSDAGVAIADIAALGVSVGPGSFTSLRIGLATAKGLAFGRAMPAVGVPTLEAMALAVLEGATPALGPGSEVVALLDARRGEWYAAGWRVASDPGARPTRSLDEGLYAPSQLALHLSGRVAGRELGDAGRRPGVGAEAWIVSPETEGWQAALDSAGVVRAGETTGAPGRPGADWVGRLAHRALQRGEGMPAGELVARYVRRAQAEAERLGGPVEIGNVAAVEPSSPPLPASNAARPAKPAAGTFDES